MIAKRQELHQMQEDIERQKVIVHYKQNNNKIIIGAVKQSRRLHFRRTVLRTLFAIGVSDFRIAVTTGYVCL